MFPPGYNTDWNAANLSYPSGIVYFDALERNP